ncbi:flagellar biosynthesis anti-sigma factor FlgM [Mucisphaera sp.]|uniref:flagellar biosynthesis anti-sigma factor FlgM n=1 Tax=Mucisphaera sp. TaxID=2913024 RepID=UPI003D0EFD0F
MSDIAPIQGSQIVVPVGGKSRPQSESAEAVRRPSDQAEISPAAQILSKLADLPPRLGLVADIREQIANGTYETEERLNGAVDALAEDLGDELL